MLYRKNSLKDKLRRGDSCRALWLFSGSPTVAEIIGQLDVDAVIIDREHSPGDLETLVHAARAIRAAGDATVLVRLRGDDPAEVKLLLDLGAEGLLFPDVRTAAQAAHIVASTTFGPHGERGAHYTIARGASWGLDAREYVSTHRNELLIGVMIESREGVENSREIAGIDGIDMLFVGPLDLSISLGDPAAWSSPDLVSAIVSTQESAREQGTSFGITALSPAVMKLWGGTLPQFITIGSDVSMLQAAAREAIAQHPRGEEHVPAS